MSDLTSLVDAISHTLSPDVRQRQAAEAFLRQKANTPGFSVQLLELAAADKVPAHVRQAAAVYMKNHTIEVYSQENWMHTPPQDRDAVKQAIVNIILSVPLSVRRQLSEVLAIVAEHEYPQNWPALVPDLATKLAALCERAFRDSAGDVTALVDWTALEGVLETLYFIFERYPERSRSDDLYREILYSLQNTQEKVRMLFVLLNKVIGAGIDAKEEKVIHIVFRNAELLCKIFYCLSWQQLPEYFEDNLESFMGQLRSFLIYESSKIDASSDDEPSPVDKLHAIVLEITNHYAVHCDEEFRPFLQFFLRDTWALLTRLANVPKYDGVVTAGIKFLTSVSRSPDYKLFEDRSALEQICKSIVVPNLELREEDEEMFEDNPVEYVRREMEGSDMDTRRRGSVELIRGLCAHFEKPVTEIFTEYIKNLLAPQSDWRKKDTALYIITALCWKKGTISAGATETSALINVVEFFGNFVMPQLNRASANPQQLETPIFTTDLIKFVISFRNQIAKEDSAAIILLCVKLLTAKETVVRTYAAACIERILTVKDKVPHMNGNSGAQTVSTMIPRMRKADLEPVLKDLLMAVIHALRDSKTANEYIMRLLLRFCSVSQDAMAPHIDKLLPTLVEILNSVTANPSNPVFNHYLFETLAALIRFNGKPENVRIFEGALLAPLCKVLIDDVTEFTPYVFQVLSQLMALNESKVPETYSNLMGPILTPTMWENKGYVPGMVQFLTVYITKNAEAVVAAKQLEAILGVFQKLLASKSTDHHALQLLDTVLEIYDLNTLAPYMQTILKVLMMRLQMGRTVKLCSNMLVTLSIFVVRFGVATMRANFDHLQKDMLVSLFKDVWLSEVVAIRKPDHRRLCAIALTEIGCGADDLCTQTPYLELWHQIMNANVALTMGIVMDKDKKDELKDATDEDASHLGAGESYSAAHSQLKWGAPTTGPASRMVGKKDPRTELAKKLKELMSRHQGKFEPIIQTQVDGQARNAIMSYLHIKSA